MPYKSCFFIGHREAGPEILPTLEDAIENISWNTVSRNSLLVITVALIAWLPGR